VAAAVGAFGLLVVPLLALKFASGKYPLDLAVYREAGRVVLHGGNPYAPAFGSHLRVPLPFTYPPFAAVAAVALALVPTELLGALWTALSLGLLGAIAWVAFRPAIRRAEEQPPMARWPSWQRAAAFGAIVGLIAWTVPLSETIDFGQINLLLAGACLLDCLRPSGRRGVLVGLATAIKLTPGIFVAYFAITRQWAAAVRAAAVILACEALAAVVLPRPSRQYWLHLAWTPGRTGNPGYFTNQSLYGVVTRLHLPLVVWPFLAAGAGVLGLRRAARAHQTGAELAAVALVGLTGVLVSPISWQHHAVWIIVVLGVLAAWAETPKQAALVVGVLALFVIPFPLLGHGPLSGTGPLRVVLVNTDVLAFVALLALLPFRGRVTLSRR
jgi:alpha-1,2-mannosyltransferase